VIGQTLLAELAPEIIDIISIDEMVRQALPSIEIFIIDAAFYFEIRFDKADT